MCLKDVEDIIGAPAGQYGVPDRICASILMPFSALTKEWMNSDGIIMVHFDAGGRVVGKTFVDARRRDGFWASLREYFGLQ